MTHPIWTEVRACIWQELAFLLARRLKSLRR